MRLSEQEIINAICMHMAERKQLQPNEITVQLLWDEDLGYSAEVTASGRSQFIVEANMKEAIERYVHSEYETRIYRNQISLEIEDEMIVIISDSDE